jgi:hypothetical protein
MAFAQSDRIDQMQKPEFTIRDGAGSQCFNPRWND